VNLALVGKTARDHRWTLLLTTVAVTLFPVVVMNAFLSFPWEMMQQFLKVPFVATMIRVLTGTEMADGFNITALGGFVFVHPVMLTVTWAFIIVLSTGSLSGEVDSGTADILLALPVSRWSTYVSVTCWTFLCCPLLALCIWGGLWIAVRTTTMPEVMDLWRFRFVVVNCCCLMWAVAGLASLVSAVSSRRGKATGVVFAILIVSFLLNWLAAFWPAVEHVSLLGVLRYFRPLVILRDARINPVDISVLLAAAGVTWSIGGIVFARRDIHVS
jgi:beta-exotoxin I transport system permease protein